MADPPIIPNPDELLGAAIVELGAKRPASYLRTNLGRGVYANILDGFRAQASLATKRLASEVVATRLSLATGDALIELAADEYETVVDPSETPAVGTAHCTRTGTAAGTIRKGHVFRRDADPTRSPPVVAAAYEAAADTPVGTGVTSIAVPIVAVTAGSKGNAPSIDGAVDGTLSIAKEDLFDATFSVASYDAGGGSDGPDDAYVRAAATANSQGQYAPNMAAIVAGLLNTQGVRHFAVRDVAKAAVGPGLPATKGCAFTQINVADASWASSAEWAARTQQHLHDTWRGFGCALNVGTVTNQRTVVVATVRLRDAKYLTFTRDIDASIRAALVDYFDNRSDWYAWKLSQLRAVISRADRRILVCTSVAVNAQATGLPLTEPTVPVAVISGQVPVGYTLTHYLLSDNGVVTTYSAPN